MGDGMTMVGPMTALLISLIGAAAWIDPVVAENGHHLPILDSTGLNPNVENALIAFEKATRQPALSERDDRAQKTAASPRLLDAVGRVVGIKDAGNGKLERGVCTGNLIGLTAKEDSRVVVTAGHCEVSKYEEAFWMTLTVDGLVTRRVVEVRYETNINDGTVGGVYDYAFLILDKAVPHAHVAPLLVPKSVWGSAIGVSEETIGRVAYLAGYHADTEIGNDGRVLTYDWGYSGYDIEDGEVPPDARKQDVGAETLQTVGFEGGSGGAVILFTEDGLAYDQGGPGAYLFGIYSYIRTSLVSSNGKKGSGVVIFIDQSKFKKKAVELAEKYNVTP